MKRLLLILILMFNFQSLSKADDIRDFEIEGMSIGDSLLNFYNKEFIKKMLDEHKNLYAYKKDKTFVQAGTISNDEVIFTNYEYLQYMVKKNDNKYIIQGIAGKIFKDWILYPIGWYLVLSMFWWTPIPKEAYGIYYGKYNTGEIEYDFKFEFFRRRTRKICLL